MFLSCVLLDKISKVLVYSVSDALVVGGRWCVHPTSIIHVCTQHPTLDTEVSHDVLSYLHECHIFFLIQLVQRHTSAPPLRQNTALDSTVFVEQRAHSHVSCVLFAI